MPKRITPLTDIQVNKAKPRDKSYKLTDGGGLYLFISPTGGKLWRMDYRYADKRKTLAFGPYPDLSLANARKRRDEARKLLADNVDPEVEKKLLREKEDEKRANTFEKLALEWQ